MRKSNEGIGTPQGTGKPTAKNADPSRIARRRPHIISDITRGHLEQGDGQGEQCLGLQHLAHGQAVALQQRHVYGGNHHEAVEKPQQIDGSYIVV